MLGYALFIVGLAVILPYAALAQAAFSKAWGLGFSLRQSDARQFLLPPGRGRDRAPDDHPQLHLFGGGGCVAVALALRRRLRRQPPADAAAAAC